MMSDKPASPFTNLGLDKALLRSRPQPTGEAAQPREGNAAPQTDTSTRARVHASTNGPRQGRPHSSSIDRLHDQLQTKQHLASQTFRFRSEELAALDRVSSQLKGADGRGLSKNDVVRLALNWLLDDYEQNGEASVLSKVRARM